MTANDPGDRRLAGRWLFKALYRRALAANFVGATSAFIYLSFVAPPQPSPPHGERFLYLAVAPAYFIVAMLVGYRLAQRRFRPVRRWLAEDRAPRARSERSF
jgi:hypothetical protein